MHPLRKLRESGKPVARRKRRIQQPDLDTPDRRT